MKYYLNFGISFRSAGSYTSLLKRGRTVYCGRGHVVQAFIGNSFQQWDLNMGPYVMKELRVKLRV